MDKYNETAIHPLALALTLAMGVAMLTVRRSQTVLPLLIVACLVTHAQRIVVFGLDFSMLRIVVVFGWARLVLHGETRHYRYHPLDGALIAWLLIGTLAYMFGPRASGAYFVTRLGVIMDAAGIYFLFRMMMLEMQDIRRAIQAFSLLAMVMVVPMFLEFLTGRNLFAVLGGVNEHTTVRDGRLRCQASFSHPIMAGNFGATTAALIAALWLNHPTKRLQYSAGLVAAGLITAFSSSSGPLIAFITALIGWSLWPARGYMRGIRWATAGTLVFIHFVRDQPVWHLVGRLSSITGGTGWHRVALINAFIEHFDEWWLLGAATTTHWKRGQGSDITNQYLIEGVRGGLAGLIAFVVVLGLGFQTAGRARKLARRLRASRPRRGRQAEVLAWALGVSLATHCMAFIGVSYFGQLLSILYLHLAMIPSLQQALAREAVRVSSARPLARAAPEPRPAAAPAQPPVPAGARLGSLGSSLLRASGPDARRGDRPYSEGEDS